MPGRRRELYRKVYGILINKLTNVSRNSIDSLCIAAFLGLAGTGMYNNYYFVMTGVVSFSAVICGSMVPVRRQQYRSGVQKQELQ